MPSKVQNRTKFSVPCASLLHYVQSPCQAVDQGLAGISFLGILCTASRPLLDWGPASHRHMAAIEIASIREPHSQHLIEGTLGPPESLLHKNGTQLLWPSLHDNSFAETRTALATSADTASQTAIGMITYCWTHASTFSASQNWPHLPGLLLLPTLLAIACLHSACLLAQDSRPSPFIHQEERSFNACS